MIKVVISYLAYPLTMAGYFIRAFERRKDVELVSVGPFTGDYIPWTGGMRLPMRYVKVPSIPLPPSTPAGLPSSIVQSQLPWEPDLWLQIDAGWWMQKPKAGVVAHIATDPHCITGDMLLATDAGIVYPEEVCDAGDLFVSDKDKLVQSSGGIWQVGMKPVRKIMIETGQELVCTDDHLVETHDGFIEAGKLRVGDSVILSCGTYRPNIGDDKDYSIGFILGAFQGDGSFGKKDFIKFTLSKKEKLEFAESIKLHLMNGFGIDVVTEVKHYTSENAFVLQIRRWGFYRFLKSLNLKSGYIPLFIRRGSLKLIGGYLAGLFAADGCSYKGRLQMTTKWETLAKELQTILFYLGVPTSNLLEISDEHAYLPGKKYRTIYIRTGSGADRFAELVGEIPNKPIRLGTRRRGVSNGHIQEFKIVGVEGAVNNYKDKRFPEPVYDVANTESGSFLANGFSVHNCLDYSRQRRECDIFFSMQRCYSQNGDRYLPYAYDPTIHHPIQTEKRYDACLIGLHYEKRDQLVNALRAHGYNVYYSIGEVYDENCLFYNESRVALNWSSLDDLNARTFEALGMGLALLTNRVPDLPTFFVERDHYLGFDNLDEAVLQFEWLMAHPEEAEEMGDNAQRKAKALHTYDMRVEQILDSCRLI